MAKKKKPMVNAKYVRNIANKFYPGIQTVLANLESTENTVELHNIREEAETKINALIGFLHNACAHLYQFEIRRVDMHAGRNLTRAVFHVSHTFSSERMG
ncbi:MAG: hypothetical protein BHW60_03695 [Sutterella sp. 54_7]|nr:MAG: hypothetical protein BHW60_03695 [Sutterella sp. 54_7]